MPRGSYLCFTTAISTKSQAMTLVFTGNNVVLPDSSGLQPATIVVEDGLIKEIIPGRLTKDDLPRHQAATWVDAGDNYILPGLVDAHVHLNEPGRTDWEGFLTGTKAAISGGVTTLVDMPLNSIPPTTTLENLQVKQEAAEGQCWTDVAFWGGIIPGNESSLKPLVHAGVKGFKCFLIESGVEEFPCVTADDLIVSMKTLADVLAESKDQRSVVLFHAELDSPGNAYGVPATGEHPPGNPNEYTTFLNSRPQKLETDAISLITTLQNHIPTLPCHIVHLSASSALPLIRAAKTAGLPLTAETCFHYLCLEADDIPAGRPDFKCCPPIRERANRDLLWEALKDGTLDCVVSDHSPCVVELKATDIMNAWGGISTLGLGLSLLWTEGKKRGITINQIVTWTSVKTAEHAGLAHKKGRLAVGHDADLIIWDPEASYKVTKDMMHFKNKMSPYEEMTLSGQVERTYLRGHLAYNRLAGGFVERAGEMI
ncbi:hypothetical protein HWV62_15565 [Athelia sp. TMB]|nr:hypothetical protein HWV62_15565 [Athelia sp. TMB]